MCAPSMPIRRSSSDDSAPAGAIILHPGDNISALVSAAPAGATFYFEAGVYRRVLAASGSKAPSTKAHRPRVPRPCGRSRAAAGPAPSRSLPSAAVCGPGLPSRASGCQQPRLQHSPDDRRRDGPMRSCAARSCRRPLVMIERVIRARRSFRAMREDPTCTALYPHTPRATHSLITLVRRNPQRASWKSRQYPRGSELPPASPVHRNTDP